MGALGALDITEMFTELFPELFPTSPGRRVSPAAAGGAGGGLSGRRNSFSFPKLLRLQRC
jgi:hypothetical protein